MVSHRFGALLLLVLAVSGCKPELDDTLSLIDGPTVLAIVSDPPEAAPGASVTYRALYVGGEGDTQATLGWAHCLDRKPLAELGPVSPRCFDGEAEWLRPLGTGSEVAAILPSNGCRNFGPEVPEASVDEPSGRPVDPDASGGFYQPVILEVENENTGRLHAIGQTRLSCGIAGVTPDILGAYQRRYVSNSNPAVAGLLVDGQRWKEGDPLPGTQVVSPGQTVELRVHWDGCEQAPCTGAEPYVSFDPVSRTLVDRRESIRISWYGDTGTFAEDRSGRAPDDLRTFSANTWTAPDTAGTARLWVVIRDDRGGVGWAGYVVEVR